MGKQRNPEIRAVRETRTNQSREQSKFLVALAEALEDCRKWKGLSRKKLAALCGVDQSHMVRLLNREGGISIESLDKICEKSGLEVRFYRKDVDEIVGTTEEWDEIYRVLEPFAQKIDRLNKAYFEEQARDEPTAGSEFRDTRYPDVPLALQAWPQMCDKLDIVKWLIDWNQVSRKFGICAGQRRGEPTLEDLGDFPF